MQAKIVKKKVSAYPFPVQLKTEKIALVGKVLDLTEAGMMTEAPPGAALRMGERFDFSFVLPVLSAAVTGEAVIVKLYDHFVAPAASASGPPVIQHLVGLQFRSVSAPGANAIVEFLHALGRKA